MEIYKIFNCSYKSACVKSYMLYHKYYFIKLLYKTDIVN